MPIVVTLSSTSVAASTLISRAMRLLGQISPGVTPTTEEYATGLEALNAMMDSWRNESLMCVGKLDEPFQLVANQEDYTIGLGGDFNTNRPVRIDGAYIVSGGLTYPMEQIDYKQYAEIGQKAATSTWPQYYYYAPDDPLGTLWVYPVPNAVSTIHLLTWLPQMAFTTSSTTAYLAPGWEEALATNLAVKIAPEFERIVPPDVREMAREAKSNIKRVNSRPLRIQSEIGALLGGGRINIITGQ